MVDRTPNHPDNALGFLNFSARGTAMGDAELVEEGGTAMSVGERLRAAREAAGLSLEDIATSTRIPIRHLESLETGDFPRLPAPTYTVGFAKNYAAAVGLDRAEIGDQLRAEMGGTRPATTTPAEVFEPADPARAMPKWLIIGTIVALLLAALMFNWLNQRSLDGPGEEAAAAPSQAAPAQVPATVAPQGQGPVVISATDTVWIEVKDGAVTLTQSELTPGASFEVPANAVSPTLTTAKPEALRITVGSAVVPTFGEPGTRVTVSLKPDDLLRPRPVATPAASPSAAQPQAAPARRPASRPAAPPSDQPTASPPPPPPANAGEPEPSPQQ